MGWARKHIDTLEEAICEFMATEPYAAVHCVEGVIVEDKGSDHVIRWERYTEPPDKLGLIAGDAVHCCRSALDHLAFALSEHWTSTNGQTLSVQERRIPEFVIATDSTEYKKKEWKLKFVDPQAKAAIETLQPYHRPNYVPGNSPLEIINSLDATDKHRVLNLVVDIPNVVMRGWSSAAHNTQFKFPTANRSKEIGAEIGRFTFAAPHAKVDVPTSVRFDLVIVGGGPYTHSICPLLRTYFTAIERLVIEPLANQFLP
jgi:hypothetical protein